MKALYCRHSCPVYTYAPITNHRSRHNAISAVWVGLREDTNIPAAEIQDA